MISKAPAPAFIYHFPLEQPFLVSPAPLTTKTSQQIAGEYHNWRRSCQHSKQPSRLHQLFTSFHQRTAAESLPVSFAFISAAFLSLSQPTKTIPVVINVDRCLELLLRITLPVPIGYEAFLTQNESRAVLRRLFPFRGVQKQTHFGLFSLFENTFVVDKLLIEFDDRADVLLDFRSPFSRIFL